MTQPSKLSRELLSVSRVLENESNSIGFRT
jgi:hypothetical protein